MNGTLANGGNRGNMGAPHYPNQYESGYNDDNFPQ